MTTVLIVDDQPLQRYGFHLLLDSVPETVVSVRRPTAPRPSARPPNCARTSS